MRLVTLYITSNHSIPVAAEYVEDKHALLSKEKNRQSCSPKFSFAAGN